MSGVNILASTALGITDTIQGFIEARNTVFSLLTMKKNSRFTSKFQQNSRFVAEPTLIRLRKRELHRCCLVQGGEWSQKKKS